ncbi:MAG TPA: hypothetical protein VMV72_08385 [Verrucomicrobiae bacterium]|nr:hypothetical protein [Verrucomicrobiae bacterium]
MRSFAAFFRPILSQLAAYHWVYDELPFRGGGGEDESFEHLIETVCSEGYIPPATLLPKFAHYVIEDWADLYGFQKSPDVAATRRHLRESPTDYEWLSRTVDICFFNVDGAWWEVYARDEALLAAVRQHVTRLPDITVQEKQLVERVVAV